MTLYTIAYKVSNDNLAIPFTFLKFLPFVIGEGEDNMQQAKTHKRTFSLVHLFWVPRNHDSNVNEYYGNSWIGCVICGRVW